jgi:hypothetical protein
MAVMVSLPLLSMSGVASAHKAKALNCTTHPHRPACQSSAGGTGTGGTDPTIVVTVNPNPVVETSTSNFLGVVQVETSPAFAGDEVTISSSQLIATCPGALYFGTEQGQLGGDLNFVSEAPITVTLDDDGNATVIVNGVYCAPGSDVVEASLDSAPYYTALTTLVVAPPQVTTTGVTGYPNSEVETGEDMSIECEEIPGNPCMSYGSDVYAVFYVETNPVYAEQMAEITDNQLADSCGGGYQWYDSYTNPVDNTTPETPLDDDGNASFLFVGSSCAATTSQVVADVLAGDHPTYTTTYTVLPPQPTI